MSRNNKNSIKIRACEQGADRSEKVENKIKEVVVVEFSAIAILDSSDTGVIL
jgi:hypothetical protein